MFQSVRSGFDVPDAFAVITDRSVGGKFSHARRVENR